VVELLKNLINIRSAQPEGCEAEIIKYIDSLLPKQYQRTYFDHQNGRASLLIKVPGYEDIDGIAFLGHVDTVAAGDEQSWMYPPFTATISDDRLYGRGAADMKSGVACMIHTALRLENKKPRYNTYFGFTADEEAGGMGVLAMTQSGLLNNVKAVVVCEPSDGRIGICEKGALWLRVDAFGKLSHGSRPDLGINAVQAVMDFASQFDKCIDYSIQNPLFGGTTLSVTKLNGGVLHNVVPDRAELCMDIRTVFGVDHDRLIQSANAVADKLMTDQKGLTLNVQVTNNRPAIEVSKDHPLVCAAAALSQKHGLTGESRGLYFYTDASQLIPAIGAPFIIFGPGDDKQAHQKDEYVNICDLQIFADIYYDLIGEELP